MYTTCAFDCFSDIYCIDRSLVCDRYKNCPNNVDEANCEYSKNLIFFKFLYDKNEFSLGHQHEPLSFRAKILLFLVLLTIISFALASILICYFCCGVTEAHSRSSLAHRERKSSMFILVFLSNHDVFLLFRCTRYRCCGNSTLISMKYSHSSVQIESIRFFCFDVVLVVYKMYFFFSQINLFF